MHRLTEQGGVCQVVAFPGPVRGMRAVTILDACGDAVETTELAVEGDLQPAGEHPGGITALHSLPCNNCGQVGRMVTAAEFRGPGGRYRQADCPVCNHPLDGCGLSDWI